MYQIGTYLVKTGHGVCRIDGIQSMAIPHSHKTALYYRMTPLEEKGTTLYVPAEGAQAELREVITPEEARQLIRRLPKLQGVSCADGREREQTYKQALKGRDPELLASMVKDLYARRQQRQATGKKVSSSDERMFKLSEDRLFFELAFALGCSKEDIPAMIAETLEKDSAPA